MKRGTNIMPLLQANSHFPPQYPIINNTNMATAQTFVMRTTLALSIVVTTAKIYPKFLPGYFISVGLKYNSNMTAKWNLFITFRVDRSKSRTTAAGQVKSCTKSDHKGYKLYMKHTLYIKNYEHRDGAKL
jgi:hypothetical protein